MDPQAQHAINVLLEHRNQLADSLLNAEVNARLLNDQLQAAVVERDAASKERDEAKAEVSALKEAAAAQRKAAKKP